MFQISILKKTAAYFLTLQLLSYATTAFCDDQFYVIWRDIGLPDAVSLVSRYSGRVILLSQEVHGTISLASTNPLSPDEIFTLFQKSLQERGLTLVRVDDNRYQIKTAESKSEPVKNIPSSVDLSGQQQEIPLLTSNSQNSESMADSKPRFNDQSEKVDSDASQSPVAKRRHVAAIFASEQRAQIIVSRLRAAGAEAEVFTPSSPMDKDFSVVLSYRDSAEGYQAMVSAIQRAGLNNLISTPTLTVAVPIQESGNH